MTLRFTIARGARRAACLFGLAALAACSGDEGSGPGGGVATVTASLASATVEVGGTTQATAALRDGSQNPVTGPLSWSSSNTAVAAVDATTGVVTGVGRGTASIIATSGTIVDEVPVTVQVLYRSITAGAYSTCDLASGGVAQCWGENFVGQLGDDSQTGRLVPVTVAGTTRFTQVSMFASHTCGLTAAGAAYCWGGNSSGQLGTNLPTNADVPAPVTGGLTFKAITAGNAHSCGLTTAGAAYCWGSNSHGQLGDNSIVESHVPVAVAGGLTFASIVAGNRVTCGITATGAAYCWGANVEGQLGTGAAVTHLDSDYSRVPVAVAGGHAWAQLSVGSSFTCGITTANVAYCWGDGGAWLGNGDVNEASTGTPAAVAGGGNYRFIDAGSLSACAITTGNTLRCWGVNLAGQLGANDPVDHSRVPIASANGIAFAEVAVAGLGEHACGISLDRLRTWCWGRNDAGQLGNGTTAVSTARNPNAVVVTGQQP